MSAELDLVYAGMFDNKVPELWHKVSYPSLKPLASWVNDFGNGFPLIFASTHTDKTPAALQGNQTHCPDTQHTDHATYETVDRLTEMDKWVKQGAPTAFWISGFYFTQSFITGTL